MTVSQYLAMLQAGGVYTPPKVGSQGNVDWNAISSGVAEPEPDIRQGVAMRPVEVVASRQPAPELMQPEIVDPAFQELYGYGMPKGQTIPEPRATSYGFGSAVVEPEAPQMRMPLLPVKGAAPKREPAPEAMIDTRLPKGMTDVGTGAEGLGPIPSEQPIAMLEPEAAPKVSPEEEAKRQEQERIKTWRSGQPFDVDLPNYGGKFTITGYSVDKASQGMAQTSLKLRDPQGAEYSIPYTQETKPIFDAASSAYKTQYDQTSKATSGDEYSSTIVVNGQRFPAKITKDQRNLPTIIYRTASGLPAEYGNFYELEEGSTFISPVDNPGALEQAKQQRQQFAQEIKQAARGVAGNIQGQLTPQDVAARLIPVPGPEPTEEDRKAGKFVPSVSFNFITDTGDVITVDKAVELGLVHPGVKQALDTSMTQRMAEITERARAREAYQQEAPTTMTEADIERIKNQKDQADTLLATAREELRKDPNNKDKKKQVKDLEDTIVKLSRNLNSALGQGRSVQGAGGVTVTEGGTTKNVESLVPTSTTGALDIYSTGAQPGKAGEVWDMRDVGREAIDAATPNFPSTGIRKDERLNRASQALTNRISEIEQVAMQKMGTAAPDILDMPVTFTYIGYDQNSAGEATQTTMSMRDAITSASAASRNYQKAMSDPNATMEQRAKAKSDLQTYHQILSGRWDIQFPGESEPTSFAATGGLEYLNRTVEYLQATSSPSARIPGTRTSAPLEKTITPPQIEVTRPPSGTNQPPPANSVSWFPGFNKGATQQGMPSKIKVNSGFNLADMIDVTNGQVFQFAVDKYSPPKSNRTVSDDMGMALGRDDGTLDQSGRQAVSATIAEVNKFMTQPAAKEARQEYATIAYRAFSAAGASITHAASGFAAALEEIYNAPDQATADRLIKKFLVDCGLNKADGTESATHFTTFMNKEIAKKLDATSSMFPNSKYEDNNELVLYRQLRASIYDLALLYRNAGVFDSTTTAGTPRSSLLAGVQPTVTWFVDWTQPSGRSGDVQSGITIPAASYDQDMAPVMNASQAKDESAMNNPLDPTIPRVIATAGSEVLDAAKRLNVILFSNGVLNKFIAESEDGWKRNIGVRGGNAYENSMDWRKPEDSLTVFDQDSKQSVAKVFTGSNVLYNLFPAYRIRGKK